MNKMILSGRISSDIELRTTPSGKSVVTFSVASERRTADKEKTADFIKCIAWTHTAEFIRRNFEKGKPIYLIGSLRNNNYTDKNGVKHYSDVVNVEEVEFAIRDKAKESSDVFDELAGAFADFESASENSDDVVPF